MEGGEIQQLNLLLIVPQIVTVAEQGGASKLSCSSKADVVGSRETPIGA
jgi:hypothetical protein